MPVNDIIGMVMACIQIGISVFQTIMYSWILFDGGWLWIARVVAFRIDILIIKYIGVFYTYFDMMLKRDIFNKTVTNMIIRNIYVFIGVVMVFRLMMVLLKYIVNPDLTSDAKLGVNSLIRRVVIGLVGMLLLPMIFNFALELQAAILDDNLIQQIIVPADLLNDIENVQKKGGKFIGTYVLAGFLSPSENAPKRIRDAYQTGIANGDLSVMKKHITSGVPIMGDVNNFYLDYVPIVSTLVLGYTLMQIAKYCLDLAVRCFRLLLYKILAPVAMIEYIIKGPDDGVFKAWKKAALSTYVSIFVRVLAMWFVIFITGLMQYSSDNIYIKDSLLADKDDMLLRAIIIVALLGFMMDLPKLIGSIFDLDLEQAGGADGVFKSITGMVKTGFGVGLGALGMMAGSAANIAGGAKDIFKATPAGQNLLNKKIGKEGGALSKMGGVLKDAGTAKRFGNANTAMFNGLMNSNPYTKAFAGGWAATETKGGQISDEQEKKNKDKAEAKSKEESDKNAQQSAADQQKQLQMQKLANDLKQNNPGMSNSAIKQEVELQFKISDDAINSIIDKLQAACAGGATLTPAAAAKMADEMSGGGNYYRWEKEFSKSGSIDASNASAIATAGAVAINEATISAAQVAADNASTSAPGTSGYIQGTPVVVQDTSSSGTAGPVSGTASGTVTLDSLDIRVAGDARATYDGDLTTEVKGKAVTTYDGDLETKVGGKAIATYDNDLEVKVGGNARATYDKDLDVQVSGNAKATYDKNLDVQVNGEATALFNGDVETEIVGNVKNTVDRNVETVIRQDETTTVEGSKSTIINNDDITQINGVSRTTINNDAEVNINGNIDINQEIKRNGGNNNNPRNN